jgi:RimJ/RimL family protein N-acetyltransferase
MTNSQAPTKTMPLTLETERLHLRQFTLDDWQHLCEMFSDEECVRFTVGAPQPDYITWRSLAGYLGHWVLRGFGPYAVVLKETGEMIGPVGMWYPGDWPEPEIKYSITRRFWGKGYVTEAGRAVQKAAREVLGRDRLISLIATGNVNSQAVAKRLGGVNEKTIPFRGKEAYIFGYDLTKL